MTEQTAYPLPRCEGCGRLLHFGPCEKVGAGTTADQCPAPSCDECHERGDCTAEENAREAAEGHNAGIHRAAEGRPVE